MFKDTCLFASMPVVTANKKKKLNWVHTHV